MFRSPGQGGYQSRSDRLFAAWGASSTLPFQRASGLSAFVSLPAVAQTNRLDNFFTAIPPYNGDRLNRPLNPVEETPDSGSKEIQESAPTTPTTIDNRSQAVPRSSNQAEFLLDSGYTEIQPATVTTPMTEKMGYKPRPSRNELG